MSYENDWFNDLGPKERERVRVKARDAVNWIIDHKHGAWGGVLLQVEWMVDVIEAAMCDEEKPTH